MAISTTETPISLERRLFSVEEFHQMIEEGILPSDAHVELRKGVVFTTQPAAERPFTVNEYQRMGEAGILQEDERVELIDGEVVVMSAINSPHVAYLIRLNKLLMALVGERAQVSIQSSVRFAPHSQPEPDLALLRPQSDDYESALPTAADILLLVEVSDSTLQEDRLVKVPLYARAGVVEFWIVNLQQKVVEVYSDPANGRYNSLRHVAKGARLTLPSFPDLELDLDKLFK